MGGAALNANNKNSNEASNSEGALLFQLIIQVKIFPIFIKIIL